MNNLKWFGKLIHFCKLSDSCKSCPYYLLGPEEIALDSSDRPCFSNKDALLGLSEWLSLPADIRESADYSDAESSWLQELIQTEFSTFDSTAEDLIFLDDEEELF